MPKVSVIVAAYNAEKYISRCLDSIVAQTLEDWECIIIDDGSKDRTGAIVDEYAARDPRFRVFHQQNGGVASARQKGLDNALGEYTLHVDSDDWIDKAMLAEMFNRGLEYSADIIFCDWEIIHPNNFIEHRSNKPNNLNHLTVLGQSLFDIQITFCNSLIKLSKIKDNLIRLNPDLRIGEDQLFIWQLLSHDVTVAYVPQYYYHYDHTMNPQSLLKGYQVEQRLKSYDFLAECIDLERIKYYYDRAIFHLAYEYLSEPKEFCPNYTRSFSKYKKNILRAKGFPFHSKFIIWLRFNHISLPIHKFKKFKALFLEFLKGKR